MRYTHTGLLRFLGLLTAAFFFCICVCAPSEASLLQGGDVPAVLSVPGGGAPLAMGGGQPMHMSGDASAGSALEDFFAGSFAGALLFGIPYEGVGTADILLFALLGYLVARILNSRRRPDDDRFDAQKRGGTTLRFPGRDDAYNDDEGEDGDERERRFGRDPLSPGRRGFQYGKRDDEDANPDLSQGTREDTREGMRPGARPGARRDNAWTRKLGNASGAARGRSAQYGKVIRTKEENAAAMWAALSGDPAQEGQNPAKETLVAAGLSVPLGFDVKDFLEGARTLYGKLQTDWAARELAGLADFLTPEMMLLLQKQAAKNPKPGKVDIMMVNAELKELDLTGERDQASVLFHATMRFEDNAQADVVSELWHFVRGVESGDTWRLSGIDAA